MALDRVGSFVPGYNAYNIPLAKDPSQIAPQIAPQGQDASPDAAALEQKSKQSEKPGLELTVEVPARENASIENLAISFGQYDSSSLDIYGDMGLASRDMKQAISGMQKDRILHEYQYFVGGKDLTGKPSNIIAGTEDGIVIRL